MGVLKRIALMVAILLAASARAQQPQSTAEPLYPVNATHVQGVGPGYWATPGAGLTLNVAAGTAYCANTIFTYAGGTLTMANNTTNYVYLDGGASCAPASNTSGFAAATVPIAVVTTSGGAITSITDDRTFFKQNSNNSSGVTTTGSPASGNLAKFSGPSTITNVNLARGIPFTIGDPAASSALTVAATTTDYFTVPVACTISGYSLGIDTGTITVKFWKVATGTAIPTSGNSINTSGVGISTGTAIDSSTVTDFTTTAVAFNDHMAMNVTAVSGAHYVYGVLKCDQSSF